MLNFSHGGNFDEHFYLHILCTLAPSAQPHLDPTDVVSGPESYSSQHLEPGRCAEGNPALSISSCCSEPSSGQQD